MADKVIDIAINVNAPSLKQMRANLAELEKDVADATNTQVIKKFDKEIKNLNKSIKEVVETGADLGATFDEVYGELLPLSTQISEAEDRMYELAKAGKVNTEEFKSLATQTAKNKQIIIETDQKIDDMANNRGLATFGTQIGSIGASLLTLDFSRANNQAKQLAMSAKNINFEDAIGQVKNLGSTFLQLGKALLANPMFLIVAAIIAIGAAIIKLLDKLGILKVIMNAVGKVFEFVGDLIDAIIQPIKDLTDWYGWTANAAEDSAQRQADAAEKSAVANEKKTDSYVIGIDGEIARAKIQGKNTEDLERKKVYLLRYTAKVRKEADKAALKAAIIKGELDAEEIAALKEKAIVSTLAYKSAKEDAKTFEVQIAQDKKDTKAASDADTLATTDATNKELADKGKAAREAREKQLKDEAKFRADMAKNIKDIQLSLIEDETERELAINAEKFKRLREDAAANKMFTEQELATLTNLYNQQELKASSKLIDDKNKLEREKDIEFEDAQFALHQQLTNTRKEQEIADLVASYEEKFLLAADNAELELLLMEEQKLKIAEIEDKFRQEALDKDDEAEKKRKALQQSEFDRKIGIASDYANAANNLTQGVFAISNALGKQDEKSKEARAKRQFQVQKALNLSLAVIDGVKAVQASLAQSPIAVGTVPNPAGIASLAFAVSTSVANIAKIASAQYKGGGGGGPSTPSPTVPTASESSSATPSFDFFGSGGSSEVGPIQSVEAGSSQNQVPIVVSVEEITSTQNRVAKISESGTL